MIHELGASVCLLLPSSTASSEEINKLLTTCDNATGGMAIDPVHLENEGDPIFLKRRILRMGYENPCVIQKNWIRAEHCSLEESLHSC